MSRTLSAISRAAMAKEESPETYIALFEITPHGSSTVHRFASMYTERLSETDDGEIYGVVSNGEEYIYIGIQAELPNDIAETATGRLSMPYSDEAVELLRGLGQAPRVDIKLVLYSDPDTVEVSYSRFWLGRAGGDGTNITADISRKRMDQEGWPQHRYTPSIAPGMF
jgi:hypothetical protein